MIDGLIYLIALALGFSWGYTLAYHRVARCRVRIYHHHHYGDEASRYFSDGRPR